MRTRSRGKINNIKEEVSVRVSRITESLHSDNKVTCLRIRLHSTHLFSNYETARQKKSSVIGEER